MASVACAATGTVTEVAGAQPETPPGGASGAPRVTAPGATRSSQRTGSAAAISPGATVMRAVGPQSRSSLVKRTS